MTATTAGMRATGDRVEPNVRDVEIEELPRVGAVGAVLDPGRDVAVLRGEVVLEHVGRFHDVVIDADQNHVIDIHPRLPFPMAINLTGKC